MKTFFGNSQIEAMPEQEALNNKQNSGNPYLWPQLRALPYFRALLRAVEASFYPEIELPHPILDVGAGDGLFASLVFEEKIDMGIDPWGALMPEAKGYGAYSSLAVADGAELPFPKGYFASAMSNSVLEHIPHLDDVLMETGRVLRSGAPFVFCVPNHQWTGALSVSSALRKVGLERMARPYEDWFIKISRHYNMFDPEEWRSRLDKAGFELSDWWHYLRPKAQAVLEWGHYFGLPSLVARKLTGRWILMPAKWNLALMERLLEPYAKSEKINEGTYSFFITYKK